MAGDAVLEGKWDHAVRVEVAVEGWWVVDHWGPGGPEDLGNPAGGSRLVVDYEAWAVFVAEVDRLGSSAVVVVAACLGSFAVVVVAVVMVVVDVDNLVAVLAPIGDMLDTVVDLRHTLVAAVAVAFAFLPAA